MVADALATTADEAVAAARRFGSPVALKILSRDIAHKSDIGGVALGVAGDEATRAAFEAITRAARERAPGARVEGVLVSPMASGGVETIVGVTRDAVFGPVVVFGLGGIFVEAFRDSVSEIAPFDRDIALRMIHSIAGRALLAGARGRPAADLDALADALVKLSRFAHDNSATIESVEINPLLARPDGVLALDALVIPRAG